MSLPALNGRQVTEGGSMNFQPVTLIQPVPLIALVGGNFFEYSEIYRCLGMIIAVQGISFEPMAPIALDLVAP
jgi:hypothetical protein